MIVREGVGSLLTICDWLVEKFLIQLHTSWFTPRPSNLISILLGMIVLNSELKSKNSILTYVPGGS